MKNSMSKSTGRQPSHVTSGEVRRGSVGGLAHWLALTPLERAVAFPGLCCDCGAPIPLSSIRCEPHVASYQAAVREAKLLCPECGVPSYRQHFSWCDWGQGEREEIEDGKRDDKAAGLA